MSSHSKLTYWERLLTQGTMKTWEMGFNKDGLTRDGGRAEARPAPPPSSEGTSENTGRGPGTLSSRAPPLWLVSVSLTIKCACAWLNAIYIKYELHTVWTETSFSQRNRFPFSPMKNNYCLLFKVKSYRKKLKTLLAAPTHRENYLVHIHLKLIFYIHLHNLHTFLKQKWNHVIMWGAWNTYSLPLIFPRGNHDHSNTHRQGR